MNPIITTVPDRPVKNVFRMTFDILTFRFTAEDCDSFNYRHLLFGLFTTWLVGIGRAWHNPRVAEFQHWGVGSLGVVVGIALLIYIIVWLLRPEHWSFFNVLTFVSLTALPGAMFVYPYPSGETKALLLLILSVWRVALLGVYIVRYSELEAKYCFYSIYLPCGLTLVGLTMLNLQHATFAIMGHAPSTPDNTSYEWLLLLSILSFFPTCIIFISYLIEVLLLWFPEKKHYAGKAFHDKDGE